MGVYREMDIDLQDGTHAFAEEDAPPAFAEDGPETAPAPQSAFAEEERQQTEKSSAAPAQSPPVQNDAAKKAEKAEADLAADAAKRKAHEEAEAKRKAEFDARQAAKKAAEKEQLDRLTAMSDDEVMAASMKRVSDDTEKLTRRNMKECVAEHIQTMCIEDPAFARKTMHPRKSMIRCFQYISRKAWDYVQDELKANGIRPGPGQQSYGCDLPDDLCYQWAVDYFNDPDAKEDHEDEEKFVPKSYYGGTTTKSKSRAKGKGKSAEKKESTPEKKEHKQPPKEVSDGMGQLSLGDFVMPEEKAG